MHWCKTVLNMLMTQNIIDENELRRFERFVTDIRRNYSEVYSIPYDRGDFLNEMWENSFTPCGATEALLIPIFTYISINITVIL